MPLTNKATIVPLHYWDPNDDCRTPLAVAESVTIENTSNLLKADNFRLWKEQISPQDCEDLARTKVSLVHRFNSAFHLDEPEKLSKDMTHRIFVCLRVIKPTRSRYTVIQLKWISENEVDVFNFTHPHLSIANVPDSEVLNTIQADDARKVTLALKRFLDVENAGPSALKRAIRCYEQGYAETRDPVIQFIVWSMGIEAMIRKGSTKHLPDRANRLLEFLSPDLDIYSESSGFQVWPRIPLGPLAPDLFHLRDLFVHGDWIPEEWMKKHHQSVAGEPISYADLLRDAAPFVLRKLIQQSLEISSV